MYFLKQIKQQFFLGVCLYAGPEEGPEAKTVTPERPEGGKTRPEAEVLAELAKSSGTNLERMKGTLDAAKQTGEGIETTEGNQEIMRNKLFEGYAESIDGISAEELNRLYQFNTEYNPDFNPETLGEDTADFANQMESLQNFLTENGRQMPQTQEEYDALMENLRGEDGRIHIPASRAEAEAMGFEFNEDGTITGQEYVQNGEHDVPQNTPYVANNTQGQSTVMQGRPGSATVPGVDTAWSGNSASGYSPEGAAPQDANPGERLGELLRREETIGASRIAELVESHQISEVDMQQITETMEGNPRLYPVLMGDRSIVLMTNPTYAPDANGDGVSSNEAIAYAQANRLLLPTRMQTDAARDQAQIRGQMPTRENQGVSQATQVANTREQRAMLESTIASNGGAHVGGLTKIWAFEPGQQPGLNGAYSNLESGQTWQGYSTVHGPDYADYSQAAQFVHPLRINASGSVEMRTA